MKFSELEKAHREYQIKSNMKTFNSYKERETWNLIDLDEENVEEDVLGFVNKWGICRIPYDRKTKLLQALKDVEEDIRYFKGKKLWEDFDYNNKELLSRIKYIFSELEKVDRISGVAISKMLHMFNHEFFVMWENAIMRNYGFYCNAEGYINFLQRMKSEIVENNLLDKYSESEVRNEVTLLKLIDEYNMERMRK